MPGGDRVGSAYVDIHVDAGPGEAEMAAFKAKVDRDFEELGRKKAEASLNLQKADFDAEIEDAKAQLDYFKKRRAKATLELAKSHFDEEIASAEAELKALTAKKRTIQIDSRQVKAANDAERLLAKERALGERAALQSAKAERSLSNEREKAVTRAFRERAELAKLGQEYEKLRGKQIGLEKSSRGVFSSRSIATAEDEARKLERVSAEADYVKHKIEALGGSVEDLDPQIERNHNIWGRWLSRLGDTTVRIGPLTTSIKGLAAGVGVLAPLVFELGGGLTALVGTVGMGAAGAFTVAAGAAAGFATSAAGVGLVIAPMISEFKDVKSASEAVYKAQLKYGKGSEQVKKAQTALNKELGGVSPIAREAFESYGSLTTRWKKLTAAARPAVFNAFGQSLKTVQSLLPTFASESTKTTQVAAKAWDGWMKSLRSSESKGLLKGVMSDFRASIPSIASGIGSLVAMMGRLSAAGAHFLPGLSHGFADWAHNLETAVGGGAKLQSSVGGMVSQMRSLGHLAQDTGSLLVHIFSDGSHSGQGMVKSLDDVINRWDKWAKSTEGKAGLTEFFNQSKGATEDFASSLSHTAKLLFEFSRATAPVANGLLQIVTWIGDLVTAADQIVGVKTIFQGLGYVLAGLFLASKVESWTSAVAGAIGRMGAWLGLTEEEAGAQEQLAAAITEATAAMTAQAEAAGEAGAALGSEGIAAGATEAGAGLEEAAGSAGLFSAALAPEVLVPAAAIGALALLVGKLPEVKTAWDEATETFKATEHVIPHAVHDAEGATDKFIKSQHENSDAAHGVEKAQKRVADLYKDSNATTGQRQKAIDALTAAEKRAQAAAGKMAVVNKQAVEGAQDIIKSDKQRVRSAETRLSLARRESMEAKRDRQWKNEVSPGQGDAGVIEAAKHLAAAERGVAAAKAQVGAAAKHELVNIIPWNRAVKELAPISQQTESGLKHLAQTIGAVAAHKIGNFVDPRQISQITQLGNKLTGLGRGSQVKNIAVKSQGADQTIGKLRTLQKQTQRVEGARATVKVSANDTTATTRLQKVSALSQRLAGTQATVNILANSANAEQAINRLRAHLLQTVHATYQAEIKAADKTGPGWNSAKQHLRDAANTKAEAKITAIDDASSKAKAAEAAVKRAGQTHATARINVTSNAVVTAATAQAAMNSVQDVTKTITIKTVKTGGGSATGGAYVPGFAGGANDTLLQREQQRAAERAERRQGGSQKVTRPTMLVGEQAPTHPEFVIATNPAFRTDNERYLEQAANSLGYGVVPAYAAGKGSKKKSAGPADSPSAPFTHESHRHFKSLKHKKFAPQVVQNMLTDERFAEREEGAFNRELSREERLIANKKMTAYEFSKLQGLLSAQLSFEHSADTERGKAEVKSSQTAEKYKSLLHGDLSQGKVRGAEKSATAIENELKHYESTTMKAPSKKAGETEAQYKATKATWDKGKAGREKHKRKLEKDAHEAKEYAERLRKERELAQSLESEARAELYELRTKEAWQATAKEAETQETAQGLLEIQENPALAPYAEGAGTGAEKPTPGEETASINAARQTLYEQFSSNITPTAPGAYGPGGGPTGPGVYYAGMSSSSAAPNYAPSAAHASSSAPAAERAVVAGGGTVNNVTNNFAAPPPDPHTYTKGLIFELGALT